MLGSRAQAIKLLTTMRGTEGQVEAMSAGLARDGWAKEPHLPAGWLAKRLCKQFVTDLAGVGLLTAVKHHVSLEVTRLCEGFVTHMAGVGLHATCNIC